ncbi:MAG: putative quorum-sensing-regulated virulence factor, partial [Sphaerospermopsis kisseleviana]
MTKVTFGKYQGSAITEIPDDYLEWGSSNLTSSKWKTLFETELNRRKQLLSDDPDKLLKKLEAEELREIQREIANCDHEYDQYDLYTEAENRARIKLKALQADQAMKELRMEYTSLLGLDSNTMDRLEN